MYMRGEVGFWCGLVGNVSLDVSYVSYMRCEDRFWGQIVAGFEFCNFEVMVCISLNYRS